MPTLTNDEMTAFLSNDAAARAEARTRENITRRAATLFSDGYSAAALGHGLYSVFTPKGEIFSVRISDDSEPSCPSCSCPCFKSRKTCKHLEAILLAIEEGAEGDARQDADDDLYAEF